MHPIRIHEAQAEIAERGIHVASDYRGRVAVVLDNGIVEPTRQQVADLCAVLGAFAQTQQPASSGAVALVEHTTRGELDWLLRIGRRRVVATEEEIAILAGLMTPPAVAALRLAARG